jgi:hypothetical protein
MEGWEGSEVLLMRADWLPPDPAVALQAEVLRVREACRAAEEKRRVEREELEAVLWAGVKEGDYVALTQEAHVRRGGLLLADEDGNVRVRQVQVVQIEGNRALVKRVEVYGSSTEWVQRDELGEVVQPGLVPPQPKAKGMRYWELS